MIIQDYIGAKIDGNAEAFIAGLTQEETALLTAEGELILSQEETATLRARAISLLPVATHGQFSEVVARYAIPEVRPKGLIEIPQPVGVNELEDGYRLSEDQTKRLKVAREDFTAWIGTFKSEVSDWVVADTDLVLKSVKVRVTEKGMTVTQRHAKTFKKSGSFSKDDLGLIRG